MSDFKAKMHQIRFRLGGAYSAPPDSLAGFKGAYFSREGREGKERGKGGEGMDQEKGRGGREKGEGRRRERGQEWEGKFRE